MEVDIKDPRPNVKLELDLLPENETVVDSIEIADAIIAYFLLLFLDQHDIAKKDLLFICHAKKGISGQKRFDQKVPKDWWHPIPLLLDVIMSCD